MPEISLVDKVLYATVPVLECMLLAEYLDLATTNGIDVNDHLITTALMLPTIMVITMTF